MKWTKELRKFDVNEEIFNKILDDFKEDVILVQDINPYKFGYKNKNKIMYDGSTWLIVQIYLLDAILNNYNGYENTTAEIDNTWMQCIVRLNREQDIKAETGVNGYYAYNYMNKLLKDFYSKEEIEERLSVFEAEYDEYKIQEHFILPDRNELLTFDNCYKYDINSAHASALLEIFPKAAEKIKWLYETRKQHPKNKAILNYYVGYLCCVNHRKTYNWIVQRTTDILRKATSATNGIVIYENTDGYIVQNPDIELINSTTIGEFKEEYHGQVRFYKDKNWYVYEIDSEKDRHKGTLPHSVRKLVNLKEKQIIHFDKVKPVGKHSFEIINIIKEVL